MRQRKDWLDYARVFAIVSISCNHAINRSFYELGSPYDAFLSYPFAACVFRAVIFIFSRLGVPFFLMITGSLLLNKDIAGKEDITHFYRHNLGRLFITCEIWTFIAFWLVSVFSEPEILHQNAFNIFLRCIGSLLFINQVDIGSMWYLPMILCIYLLIPFVNILVNKYGTKLMLIPCAVVLIGTMVIPNLNAFFLTVGFPVKLDFAPSSYNPFPMYMLYVLMGYCISNNCFRRIPTPVLYILSALTFVFSCVYQGWLYTLPGADKTYYDFLPMALSAVFLFACFHRAAETLKERRAVTYLSKISFAIYFVHIYIMTFLLRVHPLHFNPIIRFFLLETVSVGGSIVIIWILSKVSIFKKYLFMIKD